MMISILIATKDRPSDIKRCLTSILQSSFHNYEIIVIDQSHNNKTQETINTFQHSTIRYISCRVGGKSHALNIGIQKAQGTILGFTDDDCIVSAGWMSIIQQSFERFPKISAVFGKTPSYKPCYHDNQTCPCTFTNTKQAIICLPCIHYKHIGFGNNMALRKSALETLGGFKEWLGPGSIGSNAEDAEIALRLLTKGKKILYNPRMIVYHNKWLAQDEVKKQSLSYICGEMACYGYFHFQGHQFATPIILNNIYDSYHQIKNIIKHTPNLSWNRQFFSDMYNTLKEIIYRLRGLVIGWFFAHIHPVR